MITKYTDQLTKKGNVASEKKIRLEHCREIARWKFKSWSSVLWRHIVML